MSEQEIVRQICSYLEQRKDVLFWVQESHGTFDPRRKIFRRKVGYQRTGVADIQVKLMVLGLPIDVQLEVKSKTGQKTLSQMKFEHDVRSFGGFYFVVRSALDAIKALNEVKKEAIRRASLSLPSLREPEPDHADQASKTALAK